MAEHKHSAAEPICAECRDIEERLREGWRVGGGGLISTGELPRAVYDRLRREGKADGRAQ